MNNEFIHLRNNILVVDEQKVVDIVEKIFAFDKS